MPTSHKGVVGRTASFTVLAQKFLRSRQPDGRDTAKQMGVGTTVDPTQKRGGCFHRQIGVALLFAPHEVSAYTDDTPRGSVLFVQLLGVAFIGFAAANWIARHSPVGDIYGRAIVIGNQIFSLIGTLVLLGSIPHEPKLVVWLLLAVLTSGAVLRGLLLLNRSRRGSPEETT